MILCLASNKIPDISFAVHQFSQFIHNTEASHEMAAKRIFQYPRDTKDKGLVLNPSKKLVVSCYADADFAIRWRYENLRDPIFQGV